MKGMHETKAPTTASLDPDPNGALHPGVLGRRV
jgi:hypothetical protein